MYKCFQSLRVLVAISVHSHPGILQPLPQVQHSLGSIEKRLGFASDIVFKDCALWLPVSMASQGSRSHCRACCTDMTQYGCDGACHCRYRTGGAIRSYCAMLLGAAVAARFLAEHCATLNHRTYLAHTLLAPQHALCYAPACKCLCTHHTLIMHSPCTHHALIMHSVGASLDPSSLRGLLALCGTGVRKHLTLSLLLSMSYVTLPASACAPSKHSPYAQSGTSLDDSSSLLGLLALCGTGVRRH